MNVFVCLTLLLTALVITDVNALCQDKVLHCEYHASIGQCKTWQYVQENCKKSCGLCGVTTSPPVTDGPHPPVTTSRPRPPSGSCGDRPKTRIVGGTQASAGDWPWQAMLRRGSFGFCGGTLIAPQWVVTASHCVDKYKNQPSRLSVRMGAHRKRGKDSHAQDFSIETIIMHESYKKPVGLSHDIALLKLRKPATLNRYVGLACLPDDASLPNLPIDDLSKKCWITGWGRLSSGGPSPTVLMQASVPLVSKQRCERSYPKLIHDSMLCAGLDQGGVDACQGDSGGPLVCKFGGKWYLEGATSWGVGCADAGKFGVYAKLRYLAKWVNTNMNRF